MATTLVIAGYYGFGNWGDEAALAVLIRYLREALPHARIVVLSHDPAQTARLHGTEAINRWNLFEVHRALARASGFLLGPGACSKMSQAHDRCSIMWAWCAWLSTIICPRI
jgi:polysaccharide pyruvyl transferase WcaK-like protein